ncbi:MAG: hypothetical protein HP498_09985 [Nitrospira sp.]|nr:hypothetical protein [Nitrospira sp.]
MTRVIDVQMQIGQMNRAVTCQRPMYMGMPGYLVVGQAKLPLWDEAEQSIEWLAQTSTDGGSHAVGP